MTPHTQKLHHRGRKSTITLPATQAHIDAFLRALSATFFVLASSTDTSWVLKRKIRLMDGDWPIAVQVERQGDEATISCFMFIPWAWIIGFSLLIFFFLPFVPFQSAPLVFLVGLGVIALALYKQRFDFSPNASWQGPPRQLWNDKMSRLLVESFGGESLGVESFGMESFGLASSGDKSSGAKCFGDKTPDSQ